MDKQDKVYEHLKTIATSDTIVVRTRTAQIKIDQLAKELTLTKHETIKAIEALRKQNRIHLDGRTKYILFD
jgi:hypothetical protein